MFAFIERDSGVEDECSAQFPQQLTEVESHTRMRRVNCCKEVTENEISWRLRLKQFESDVTFFVALFFKEHLWHKFKLKTFFITMLLLSSCSQHLLILIEVKVTMWKYAMMFMLMNKWLGIQWQQIFYLSNKQQLEVK
ncbi:CLUMA_CG019677, isoform A [Clunio marinus]|uniref:CLUMA_CG019677, isoform A n=1 Tax=Clunio marinus TaxID=568069 RepID=A0A1J1J226_9DIPT|nr:CLUMA_CG019677, isoform A [Clunio marinus]